VEKLIYRASKIHVIVEQEPNDVIILSAISQGAKKFDKIVRKTKIDGQEVNKLLERLEDKGLITVVEKKGWFGPKKEIMLTEKGIKELDERRFELQKNWEQMVTIWKGGDKQKLQQHMEENKSILPSMMFLGIMDMMMFSTMMGFMGLAMTSFMPDQYMDGSHDMGGGHDGGQSGQDFSGGDFHGDGGPGDMGGFDVNF
jgi:DNA-binding PadR family transcriptional regulator